MAANKWIWEPSRQFVEQTNVYRFMKRLGFSDRETFLRFSRDDPERFWSGMVQEAGIEWFEPNEKVVDTSRGVEWARWFVHGKLNIAYNCVDRHAAGPAANRVACISESKNGRQRSLRT